ncbi:MAG: regulatory protein RecX [Firmicutes bacterium]|nr:regulatory protein RecX [Bacillota bacterium]
MQKHKKNRFSVFIDNEFAFGIDGVDLLYYKLKAGEEISREKYQKIIENAVFTKCKDKAASLLAHSPKTKKELKERLLKEDYPEDIIQRVTDLLEKYGYIDDEAYARAYIQDKFNLKGYGRKKLQYELYMKGIPKDTAEKIIDEFDLDEAGKALSLLKQKYGEISSPDPKTKQKMYGYLLRRGYGYDIISECFSKIDTE